MRKLHEMRKAQGLCLDCGKPAREGKTRCEACAARMSMASALYIHKLKLDNRCPRCKKPLPEGWGRVVCADCRVAMNASQQALRNRRRAAGKCPTCGVVLTDKRYKTCPECRARSLWNYKKGVIRLWRG